MSIIVKLPTEGWILPSLSHGQKLLQISNLRLKVRGSPTGRDLRFASALRFEVKRIWRSGLAADLTIYQSLKDS